MIVDLDKRLLAVMAATHAATIAVEDDNIKGRQLRAGAGAIQRKGPRAGERRAPRSELRDFSWLLGSPRNPPNNTLIKRPSLWPKQRTRPKKLAVDDQQK